MKQESTITITPTWFELSNAYLAVLRDGTPKARSRITPDLERAAMMADTLRPQHTGVLGHRSWQLALADIMRGMRSRHTDVRIEARAALEVMLSLADEVCAASKV